MEHLLFEKLKSWAVSSPVGRSMFRLAQPAIRLRRRWSNPNLPDDQKITKVQYGDRQFSLLQRRWSVSDDWAVRQCFSDLQYELPRGIHADFIKDLYAKIVASGRKPLIVDCGANIGASVTWFSARYPDAHIIAVEPAPDNCQFLHKNCVGLDVDIREVALSSKDGRAMLANPNQGLQMAYRLSQDSEGPEVNVVSLKTLLSGMSDRLVPFLLKVDIEGAEEGLFAGDNSLCNSFPLIVLEPHDWLLPGKSTLANFLKFHIDSRRDLCLKDENLISINYKTE